ncbi:MAG TPA: efflux RND transporter periplasmic adaptor subunit [Roseomonas sp.]
MQHARTILLSAVALAALGLGGVLLLGQGGAQAVAGDPRRDPPLVRTAVVRPATAPERGFTGIVTARVQSNLGFRVQGKVTERLVDTGQRVRAGQPLLRIDPRDLGLAMTARENAVAAARALAVQATADEARYRSLLASGWAPRQRYEQARAALDSANAQLAAATAEAEVARNETGYAVLTADADGTVVETLAEPGQVVAAGQAVVRLAHAGAREASVNLPETARPAIGSPAQASLYGDAAGRSAARLRQISDAADPMSRTYEARYVLEGTAAAAPLGATVTVWVPTGAATQEAEIPLGALFDDGRASGAWIVDAATSTVVFRPVAVRRLAQETAIVTGLAPGDRVVALGAQLLYPGAPVRLAAVAGAAR